jgi:simple sugar transport system permease protein
VNNTVIKVLRKPITSAIVAILIGFLVAAIVLASAGYDPGASFAALFSGMVGRPRYIVNVIIKATPLLLCGIGVAFAFKVGLFNIGAEGQYILGTVAATIVGITCDLPAVLEIPLVVLSGTIAGRALRGAHWMAQGKVWHPRGHHQHHVQLDQPLPLQLRGLARRVPPAKHHGNLCGT